MLPAIETCALTKRYPTGKGVREIALVIEPGEIMGLLGPNGAGKTTLIRLLLDFIRPDSGWAKILGRDCQRESLAVRREIGYLPGEIHLEEALTGRELLDYYGRYRRGLSTSFRRQLVEGFELPIDCPIRTYSKGMKQKLAIIQSLMHRPKLLILDEPTEGLDPLNQQIFFSLLAQAKADGSTILMSSHVLSEVERNCDRVALIRDGTLLVTEAVEPLLVRAGRLVTIEFDQEIEAGTLLGPGVELVGQQGRIVTLRVSGKIDRLIKQLGQFSVCDLRAARASLEEIFLHYYSDGTAN